MRFDYRYNNIILILLLIRQATEKVFLLGCPNLIEIKLSNPTYML